MKLLFLILAVGAATASLEEEEYIPSYEGAKVYRLAPATEEQFSELFQYYGKEGHDFLRAGRALGETADVLVYPDNIEPFENFLAESGIESSILSENIQNEIDEEAAHQRSAPNAAGRAISFSSFQRYDDIVSYLRQVAANYPRIASVFEIGSTTEGRPLVGLKLSSGGSNKPAILIDGGIHAREWIAPSSVVYFVNQLAENSANSDLLSKVDWYIIPVLNPDGYEYTHTDYRLWRKTRSVNRGSTCRGTDPNRNFGFHWMDVGASSSPCSETFAGKTAFSEPETAALRDFVLENAKNIKLYLTFHSYGNYLLYPWGFTSALPSNDKELRSLALQANKAISSVRGTRYTIGTSTNVLYAAAGGSDDWVKGVGGVELSYTVELPGGGSAGFNIPASQIIPVGEETFLGVRVFGEYIADKFGK